MIDLNAVAHVAQALTSRRAPVRCAFNRSTRTFLISSKRYDDMRKIFWAAVIAVGALILKRHLAHRATQIAQDEAARTNWDNEGGRHSPVTM